MRAESTTAVFRDDLSALAREYDDIKSAARFIGRRVAPVAEVASDSGGFPIFNRET